MRRLACLVMVGALLALPAAAAAGCPRTTLGAVENDVMCLECGTPLAVAEDGPAAQRERALIEQLIGECRSRKQIENALVAQYGERVLALPRARGFTLSAYLIPAAALAAGLLLVAALWWRWRRTRPARREPPPAASASSGDAARLDADLERYRL